ncbi:MAG: hypothetical protein AAFX94_20635, partial [Myxococcota bacterium]
MLHLLSADKTDWSLIVHDGVFAVSWGWVWFRERRFAYPDLWLLALGFCGASVVLHAMAKVALPRQDAFMVILIVASGALLASWRLLVSFVVVVVAAWLAVSLSHPLLGVDLPRLGLIGGASAMAYLLSRVRDHGVRRVDAFRQHVLQQRCALQEALDSAQEELHVRMKVEENLKSSETRFQALFAHLTDGVATLRVVDDGQDFEVTDLNRASYQIAPEHV